MSGGAIQIFAGTISHAGDDIGRLAHVAGRKDSNLLSGAANQFDRADGALRIPGRDIDDNDFRTGLLKLPDNGIGRINWKSDMAEDFVPQACRLQAIPQGGEEFPVFGQKGDCNPMHGAVLADFSRCLHVRKREYPPPSDLGN